MYYIDTGPHKGDLMDLEYGGPAILKARGSVEIYL